MVFNSYSRKLRDSRKGENVNIQKRTENKQRISEVEECGEMQMLVITQNKGKQESMHRQAKPNCRILHFPCCSISILYFLVFQQSLRSEHI